MILVKTQAEVTNNDVFLNLCYAGYKVISTHIKLEAGDGNVVALGMMAGKGDGCCRNRNHVL